MSPPCVGRGCWAGAPAVAQDERAGLLYLSYRLRAPSVRGYETRVAVSQDGLRFHDVWRLAARSLASPSIERSALVVEEHRVRLYVSYVDGADRRWRIDLLEARAVEALDASRRVPALTAAAGVEGVKDPVVLRSGEEWLLFASCAVRAAPGAAALHGGSDAFATGLVRSATGLAASEDGVHWRWQGLVLEPADRGWDAYETRLTCVLPVEDGYLGFYDGIASAEENYEERTGVARSRDLRAWRRTSRDAPVLAASEGTGSLRYVTAARVRGAALYYYECARPDGSHELRRSEAV